jgi:hypothetical protein
LYEEASLAKSQAVTSDKKVTEARISKVEAGEKQGWDDSKERYNMKP